VCVVALILSAVAAASTLDGAAVDLVAGDDGDGLCARRRQEPALIAAPRPRESDIHAAPRRVSFVAALSALPPAREPATSCAVVCASSSLDSLAAFPPLPSRAPPLR
jgi:hypothetical protein